MRNHLLLLLVLREIRSVKRLTFGLFFIAYSIKRRDLSSTSFSARFEVKWSASSIIRSFGQSVVCTSCHCLIHSSSSLVLRVILLAIQIAFSRELIHIASSIENQTLTIVSCDLFTRFVAYTLNKNSITFLCEYVTKWIQSATYW